MNQIARRKKILVIPTDYVDIEKMKIRIIELALGLGDYYVVYLLTWHSVLSRKISVRLWNCFKDVFRMKKITGKKSLNLVKLPLLHQPLALALRFNSFFLKRFIEEERIDTVFSGSYHMFDIPEKRDFKYIFDLADLPATGNEKYFDRFVHKQTRTEVQKADVVTAVSQGLADYVKERYNRQAHVIPNGAYIEKLRSVNIQDVADIRRRYNLENKWVIGYIGLIGSWVEVDLLVKAFWKAKEDITNAVLMLVGASPYLDSMRKKYASNDIIITGTLKGDAAPYINLFDVGVLAHAKTPYQDVAFHIKLIEYTAARKIVVSTPINEVKRLDFPNIIQADLNVDAWVKAFKKARQMKWQAEWDKLVEPYDWGVICNRLVNAIGGIK